ncbi:MAG: TonB-dependent receptor plug domain-containing protein [Bacteroidales bacterium]|nr:TonB-dependent receptor plug domain-containing protein [Bacteroidales bacterium]
MKPYITILFLLLTAFPALAQDEVAESRIAYNKAEGFYDIGQFDEAIKTLDQNSSFFLPAKKNSVLRLYALCYMASDNPEMCRKYVRQLLDANPGYTSVNDPPRFRDLIEELRKGSDATISTASFSSESVEEAPVPVTVITQEMIRAAGAQTIQDALVAYVPGISVIETNGIMNFAYRGIYGLAQEKMLFMLNGIRLNSYYSNTAMTDYSISLKKIKQIEVLRGPSSSLYGDVSLTGVVNIITKDGGDLDGIEVNAGAGNFGQLKAGLTVGKHIYDFDIFAWCSIYRSDGERAKGFIDTMVVRNECSETLPEDIIIGGYNNKPSYDFGINLKYKGLSVLYSCNSSKTVTPYAKYTPGGFEPYSYYKYTEYFGNKPGTAYQDHNVKLKYEKDWGRIGVTASATYNKGKMTRYYVESDSSDSAFDYYEFITHYDEDYNFSYEKVYYGSGVANFLQLEDENYTGSIRANYAYGNSRIGGTVVFGFDYGFFKDLGEENGVVYHFNKKNADKGNTLLIEPSRKEPKNDFYLQIKQRFGRLIVNSGLRFDYKKHCSLLYHSTFPEPVDSIIDYNRIMKEWSPRISLVYTMDRLNFKFNYSKSFVDAPYRYRTSELNVFFVVDIEPETLHSFQLTASSKKFVKGLETELNFYYNDAKRILNSESQLSYNWDVTIIGAELVAKYSVGKFNLNANLSLSKVSDYKGFVFKFDDELIDDIEYSMIHRNSVFNVPNFTSNIVAGYKFFDKMRLDVNLCYMGRQYFKAEMLFGDGDDDEVWKIPQVFLVSPSLNFDFKHFMLDISVHNAFNHKYSLGGKSIRPIQQKGAWLMMEARYRF